MPSRNIRSIREDTEGKLWINTISGIACYAGGKLQAYTTYRGKAVTEFFLQARDGSMWFRSGTDVVRFGADGSIATLAGGFMVQEARDGVAEPLQFYSGRDRQLYGVVIFTADFPRIVS